MNKAGDVVLHVPENHETSILARNRAGWLRCRLLVPEEGQPTYTASPRILSLSAFTIGGTARMVHAQVIRNEDIGVSDGTPAQRFPLQRRPVVPWEEPERAAGRSTTPGSPTGPRWSTSPSPAPTTPVSTSTPSPARCSSARRCGRVTGRCGSTAPCRPRAPTYDSEKDVAVHAQIEQRIAALPGVESVTTANTPYIAENLNNSGFLPEGENAADYKRQHRNSAEDVNVVGNSFFHTMEIPILAGRSFDARDTATSAKVAVINQALAQKRFPGVNPIGRRFEWTPSL